ncbi:hypothetical protein F5Y15DRAFT_414694 [Xylariaceae sp. FL0016]|nr:hypothetical protein F5Y15DRAFT_414694 [Xylariaceae sp. FL0016]
MGLPVRAILVGGEMVIAKLGDGKAAGTILTKEIFYFLIIIIIIIIITILISSPTSPSTSSDKRRISSF